MPGNSGNSTLCRRHNRAVKHYTGRELECCWGNTKKPLVQQETQCTVKPARSPASGMERVSNCNRTCFCTIKVLSPDSYHAKVVYLSLRRMYSGGMCGSPRLLHRGFQLFRGLTMGTAGWSTIAKVVSTTIRKPRTKRTAGKPRGWHKVRNTGSSGYQ